MYKLATYPHRFIISSLVTIFAVVSGFMFLFTPLVQAQVPANIPFQRTEETGFVPCGDTADNPCTIGHLFAAMIAIINYLIATAGFIAVAMIVYAGLRMVWARGDQAKLTEAKGRLSGAVIGIVLVSLAFILINSLFSGSLSLGIKDGALILTNPVEYIGKVGQPESTGK